MCDVNVVNTKNTLSEMFLWNPSQYKMDRHRKDEETAGGDSSWTGQGDQVRVGIWSEIILLQNLGP